MLDECNITQTTTLVKYFVKISFKYLTPLRKESII
uniref:Uncharacterized protein n=1 Tax=Bacteriophage sp. TaxID=38018 RepID=A0A8D9PEK9_9VIRU|nr:MAG TPA: hypothetical protein [Bacteriophage sp.]